MIHKTAIIEPGAQLGSNVAVGPYAYIEGDVTIGDGCVLGPHVTILRYTTLGANCQVHANAVLGDVAQDLGYKDARSYVRIGAGCTIREGVTVHRGTKPESVTELGDGCFMMAYSHFAHNVKCGRNVIVANGALLAGYVEVGDRAFISGNVVIHQLVRIGRIAMLGGDAAVSKDVPPFCTVRPAAVNKVLSPNIVGLRRAGFSLNQREEVRQTFKMLYRSGLNITQALAKIRATFPTGPAIEMADFIEASRRGVCGFEEGEEPEE